MRRDVVFTITAVRDLGQSTAWLNQAGSGRRSKSLSRTLSNAAEALATTADIYPADRFFPNSRQLVVQGYVIRYAIVASGGREFVSIQRIYGPGQDREIS